MISNPVLAVRYMTCFRASTPILTGKKSTIYVPARALKGSERADGSNGMELSIYYVMTADINRLTTVLDDSEA
jgi:hypothetical protein